MTSWRTTNLSDLDERQSEVLARLDQLDQRIEQLLRCWSAAESTAESASDTAEPAPQRSAA